MMDLEPCFVGLRSGNAFLFCTLVRTSLTRTEHLSRFLAGAPIIGAASEFHGERVACHLLVYGFASDFDGLTLAVVGNECWQPKRQ